MVWCRCSHAERVHRGTRGSTHWLRLDDALQRLPLHQELQDVWPRMVPPHIAARFGHQHGFERPMRDHDRFFALRSLRKDVTSRRTNATAGCGRLLTQQKLVKSR